jgi:Protein of unknown function (DUF2497)
LADCTGRFEAEQAANVTALQALDGDLRSASHYSTPNTLHAHQPASPEHLLARSEPPDGILIGRRRGFREMLRPMLRAWLDDNLPAMVERLVRDEIKRLKREQ